MTALGDVATADLLEHARLVIAVGAAQRRLAMALNAPLGERIAAALAMCDSLAELIAHERPRRLPGLRGSLEMAVNEYAMLADLLAAQGDMAAARSRYERLMTTVREDGGARLTARATVDFAFFVGRDGFPARAMALLFAARDELAANAATEPDGLIDPVIKVELGLASFLRWLGDFDRCEAVLGPLRSRTDSGGSAALQLADESMMLALDRAQLASSAERGPLLDEAQLLLDRLLPAYRAFPAAQAGLHFQAMRLLAMRDQPAAALALADTLLPHFEREPLLRQKQGTMRVHRSRLLQAVGRTDEALRDARAGVEQERAFGQRDTVWRAWWQLARAQQAAGGASTSALGSYDAAITALGSIRTATLGLRLDNMALRTARPMIDEAVARAASAGDGRRAACYADAVKSRFLALALARGAPPAPREADVERLDDLGASIDAAESSRGDGDKTVERLVASRAELVERMRLRPSEGAPEAARTLDFDALLEGLRARDQAALQLYLAGSTLTAVVLSNGRARVGTRELDPQTMDALKRFERNLLLDPPQDQHTADYDPMAWGLSCETLLSTELIEAARRGRSLLVCPHGLLNLLPWSAMPLEGMRLFEHLQVGTVPSLQCIEALARRAPANGRVALIGNPVPAKPSHALSEADAEIAAIAALYIEAPRGAGLLRPPQCAAEATLPAFRALVARGDTGGATLHMVCHGSFRPEDPAGAALHLTGRTLTAAEIALRPLRFGEVTLSACSTGLRPTTVAHVELLGDDMVGLSASFLEAGAAAVLSSIMPATSRANARLFQGFHRRRLAGASPLAAFAETQRALISDGAPPLTEWIGFSLAGVH